jgi:hypothetical protein
VAPWRRLVAVLAGDVSPSGRRRRPGGRRRSTKRRSCCLSCTWSLRKCAQRCSYRRQAACAAVAETSAYPEPFSPFLAEATPGASRFCVGPRDNPALPLVRGLGAQRKLNDKARSAFAGHANHQRPRIPQIGLRRCANSSGRLRLERTWRDFGRLYRGLAVRIANLPHAPRAGGCVARLGRGPPRGQVPRLARRIIDAHHPVDADTRLKRNKWPTGAPIRHSAFCISPTGLAQSACCRQGRRIRARAQ